MGYGACVSPLPAAVAHQYRYSNMKPNPIRAFATFLLVVLTGCASAEHKASSASWGPPSDRAVKTAQAQKRPVVIAFDADWCMQTRNAKKFFDSPHGKKLLASTGARSFRVNCNTSPPTPACRDLMKRYGIKAVPAYIIFQPGRTEPVLLDGGDLTPGSLRDALAIRGKME
jgi:thiol:disulfide interchange protein